MKLYKETVMTTHVIRPIVGMWESEKEREEIMHNEYRFVAHYEPHSLEMSNKIKGASLVLKEIAQKLMSSFADVQTQINPARCSITLTTEDHATSLELDAKFKLMIQELDKHMRMYGHGFTDPPHYEGGHGFYVDLAGEVVRIEAIAI